MKNKLIKIIAFIIVFSLCFFVSYLFFMRETTICGVDYYKAMLESIGLFIVCIATPFWVIFGMDIINSFD